MKGFDKFLASLLPGVIESGRIKFTTTGVKSAVKGEEGQIILRSELDVKTKLTEEICVPHLSQLQKAYAALDGPKIKIQYEHDIAARLTLSGDNSKVSMFLMDKDLVAWPSLNKEPEYTLILDLPNSTLESLKTNFSLVDGVNTTITSAKKKLSFRIGDEEHENSATTVVPTDIKDEYSMIVRTEFLSSIINNIPANASVTLSSSSSGLTKFTVVLEEDEYSLLTEYFLIAVMQ